MELSIYRECNFISKIKMCGHFTTHYNMYMQDMLRTVLAFQIATLCTDQSTMLHNAH